MTGALVQMLATARDSGGWSLVSDLIALVFILGVLVAAGWVLVFDRRRDRGVAPLDSDIERNGKKAA